MEAIGDDSLLLLGLTGLFKVDPAAATRKADSQTIHLAAAKIPLSSGNHDFYIETPTPLIAGQFLYRSSDRLLTITNLADWDLLIVLDPEPGADEEAIYVTSNAGYTMPISSMQ